MCASGQRREHAFALGLYSADSGLGFFSSTKGNLDEIECAPAAQPCRVLLEARSNPRGLAARSCDDRNAHADLVGAALAALAMSRD
jgi:hypothetical protein